MNKDLSTLIYEYKIAYYALAVKMSEIKKNSGRKVLEDLTTFDLSRIRYMCRIGDIYDTTSEKLLPELVYEVVGETPQDRRRYLRMAITRKYKASDLRRFIRNEKQSKTIKGEDKDIKVNTWHKNILLLENDIKSMDTKEKKRALAHITNVLCALE